MMKLPNKNKAVQWLKVPVNILLLLLTYVAIRWLGVKGLLGILIGLSMMAYLIFTKNPTIVFFTNLFSKRDDTYQRIDEQLEEMKK